jgi:DNA-binding GntR family transcriptional regulator
VLELKTTQIAGAVADETERERLRLESGDAVYRIRRIGFIGARPLLVEHASLPAILFPGLASMNPPPEGIVQLALRFGIRLGNAQERVSVAPAPGEVAMILQVAAGALTAVLDRVVLSSDGRPVEWRLTWRELGQPSDPVQPT